MTELDNHYSQRVIFKPGKQREFILNIKNKLGFNVDKIAELINVSSRTLRDWKREKFSMSLPALKTLCKLSGVTIPSDIEIKKPFWYTNLGANKGWFTIQKDMDACRLMKHIEKRNGMSGGRIKENFKIEIFFTLFLSVNLLNQKNSRNLWVL